MAVEEQASYRARGERQRLEAAVASRQGKQGECDNAASRHNHGLTRSPLDQTSRATGTGREEQAAAKWSGARDKGASYPLQERLA